MCTIFEKFTSLFLLYKRIRMIDETNNQGKSEQDTYDITKT